MKKILIFTIMTFLSVSCMYEDCICSIDSDIVSDADSENCEDLSNSSDGESFIRDDDDISTTTDENSSKNDELHVDADNEQECGNGKIETGEICDLNSIECSQLDSNFESGMAVCNSSCRGWDTTNCVSKTADVTPLATIPAKNFTIDYLYNGVDDFNNAANQSNELYSSPLFSASITLTTGTYYIPHSQANTHWLAGFYDTQAVQFVQQSYYVDDSNSSSFTTPYIVMGATISDAKAGAELSIGIKNENEVNFIVTDIMNDSECIILVGYGSLTVNSINIAAGSTGNFSFTTSAIGLYLPSQTPEGDVTSDIESSGFTVCQ